METTDRRISGRLFVPAVYRRFRAENVLSRARDETTVYRVNNRATPSRRRRFATLLPGIKNFKP